MYVTNFLLVAATTLALGSTAIPTVHNRAHLRAPRDHIRYTNLNGTHVNATEPALYFDGTIKLCSHIAIAGNCVEMFITDPGTAGIPSCNMVDVPGNPDVMSLYVDAPLMKSWTCRFFRADQEKICDHSVDYIELTGKAGIVGLENDIVNDLDLSESENGPRGNWTNNVGQVLCMGSFL